ncbi:MAG TPA: TetR/AcrR family transcriptional regulator [Gemmatimonadales bacterium]
MDVRDRILKAAVSVFSEVGFRGATTRRIARAADVSEITLFRHFGSKGRLLQEAITCEGTHAPRVPLPDDPQDPMRDLLAWSGNQLRHLRERRAFIRTCMAEMEEHPEMLPPGSPPALATRSLADYLRRLKAQGTATAAFDPDIAAPMLMGALFADAMGRDAMPDLYQNDPDRALTQYIEMFLRAIGVGVKTDSSRQDQPA